MLLEYVKRGFYHTLFLSFTSIFSRFISFLFLPYFLSKLTLAEFGIWDFYQNFFSLGTLMLSSGAAMALMRFCILYKDEPVKQKQSIGNACIAVFVLILLLLLISPIIFFMLRNNNIGAHYFFISLFLTILFSFFSLLLVYLRVCEELVKYAFIFCAQSILATLLTVVGISYFGITSFFYAHSCSLLLFLPLFFKTLTRYMPYYSWPLFKEQFLYAIPLLVYNFIYMGFFTIDRLFLKSAAGYEAVGIYALLWRFGALYQFFSIALVNAAPIVIFNAQKEKNGSQIIQRLLMYAFLFIILGSLISIYVTQYVLNWFFKDFSTVHAHIPVFFAFLCMLEIARFMQTGFHLATKTLYIPLLASTTLLIQAIFLFFLNSYGVFGICYANMCTFMLYAAISCGVSYAVYKEQIIDYKRMAILVIAFLLNILLLEYAHLHGGVLVLFWSFLVWFAIITPSEKKWLAGRSLTSEAWCREWFKLQPKPKFLSAYTAITVREHCYSNAITNKKISILGPYPPPLGGISVHIKRVGEKLQKQQNNVTFFDTIKRPKLFVSYLLHLFNFLQDKQPEIVYYHTPYSFGGVYEFLFLIILQKLLSFEFVLIEHDARYSKELSWVSRYLLAWSVARVSKVVFIGNTPYISYVTANMLPKKFTIEAAFLPPDLAQEQNIVKTYPENIFSFIDNHYPIILANAFQLRLWEGVDLYGYDMCLELLQKIEKIYPNAGLIFALATINNELYYNDNIFILHGQKELWPLFKYADIFVRPTASDNYGISVAEALFFGIPAIASDVCIRPHGTILFTSRDKDDFYLKVMHALSRAKAEKVKGRVL